MARAYVFLGPYGATWPILDAILARAGFGRGPKIVTLGHHLEKMREKGYETEQKHKFSIENLSRNERAADVKVSVWQGICCKIAMFGVP